MKVTIEPLAIGNVNGPTVYILVRRVGTHLDVETMPDYVEDEQQALDFASSRWQVPADDVDFKALQVIEIEP